MKYLPLITRCLVPHPNDGISLCISVVLKSFLPYIFYFMGTKWSPPLWRQDQCPSHGLEMQGERVTQSAFGSHGAVTVSTGTFWKNQKGFGQGPKTCTCWSILGHSDKPQGVKKSSVKKSHNFLCPAYTRALKQNPCPFAFGVKSTLFCSFRKINILILFCRSMLPHALCNKWKCVG